MRGKEMKNKPVLKCTQCGAQVELSTKTCSCGMGTKPAFAVLLNIPDPDWNKFSRIELLAMAVVKATALEAGVEVTFSQKPQGGILIYVTSAAGVQFKGAMQMMEDYFEFGSRRSSYVTWSTDISSGVNIYFLDGSLGKRSFKGDDALIEVLSRWADAVVLGSASLRDRWNSVFG